MKKRVMVVDDSRWIGDCFQKFLSRDGFEVVSEIKSGEEALQIYPKIKPDLITLDVNMPGLNGIKTLERLIRMDSNAKVIMVTALSQPLLNKDMLERGAKAVVKKPIRLPDLLRTVKAVISQKEKDYECCRTDTR